MPTVEGLRRLALTPAPARPRGKAPELREDFTEGGRDEFDGNRLVHDVALVAGSDVAEEVEILDAQGRLHGGTHKSPVTTRQAVFAAANLADDRNNPLALAIAHEEGPEAEDGVDELNPRGIFCIETDEPVPAGV